MAVTIYGGKEVFNSKQTIVIYQGYGDDASYPIKLGQLAPNTNDELYTTGTLLSQYTVANAPSPALVGMYVNFDSTSSNPDQLIVVGVITGQMIQGVTGVDTTSIATATATNNEVNIMLWSVGVKFYENAISQNNAPADVTDFYAQFDTLALDSCTANGGSTNVLKVIAKV